MVEEQPPKTPPPAKHETAKKKILRPKRKSSTFSNRLHGAAKGRIPHRASIAKLLPPPVNPHPLFRVSPYDRFDLISINLGHYSDVFLP